MHLPGRSAFWCSAAADQFAPIPAVIASAAGPFPRSRRTCPWYPAYVTSCSSSARMGLRHGRHTGPRPGAGRGCNAVSPSSPPHAAANPQILPQTQASAPHAPLEIRSKKHVAQLSLAQLVSSAWARRSAATRPASAPRQTSAVPSLSPFKKTNQLHPQSSDLAHQKRTAFCRNCGAR